MLPNRLRYAFAPIPTDFFRDRRFACGADGQLAFIGLTCHANEQLLDGLVSPRDLRMVEASLDWPDGRWPAAVKALHAAGLLRDEGTDACRLVPFFGLDRQSRDAAAARQKRYRDRKRDITRDGVTRDVTQDVAVTPQSKSKRKSKETEAEVALTSNGHALAVVRPDVDQLCDAFVRSLEQREVLKRTITEQWRKSAALMLDKDGRELSEVLEVIAFVTDDDFWRGTVLSLPKLRDKYDTLRMQRRRSNGAGMTAIDRNARELLARGVGR